MYSVTTLDRSASVTDAARLHWKEYLMEGTELAALMLSTCICGTFTYGDESPFKSLSSVSKSVLMGAAIAMTTLAISRSPFGRRSGAHLNPSVTLTFFWLGRVHHWDAAWYSSLHGGSCGRFCCTPDLGFATVGSFGSIHGDGAGETRKRNDLCR